jgi:hypothetical protein
MSYGGTLTSQSEEGKHFARLMKMWPRRHGIASRYRDRLRGRIRVENSEGKLHSDINPTRMQRRSTIVIHVTRKEKKHRQVLRPYPSSYPSGTASLSACARKANKVAVDMQVGRHARTLPLHCTPLHIVWKEFPLSFFYSAFPSNLLDDSNDDATINRSGRAGGGGT